MCQAQFVVRPSLATPPPVAASLRSGAVTVAGVRWGARRAILWLYRATPTTRLGATPPGLLQLAKRPALVLWGDRDPYLPARYAERQRMFFPQAEVHLLARQLAGVRSGELEVAQ
jgi:pimeloyl-ACP methyl ester carboxylesterase